MNAYSLGAVKNIYRGNSRNTSIQFDDVQRVSVINHNGINSSGFSYNPASQIHTRTNNSSLFDHAMPSSGVKDYIVNNLNQYESVGGKSYTYDKNGNLKSAEGYSYTYDSNNRLLSVIGNGTNVSLTYDPKGRLLKTNANGAVIHYLYDGDALVAEYNNSGNMLRRYVHGTRVDDPLVWYEGSNTSNKKYLLTDERGSIVAETNGSGSVVATHKYGAYGEPGDTSSARFRYTGQILIPGTELYLYKARVYNPDLGRFLQTDPVGYEDQMNLYAYVYNDPLNNTDPTGMCGPATPACIIVARELLKRTSKKIAKKEAKEAKKKEKKQQQREKRERAGNDIETHNGEKVDPKTLQKKHKSKHGKNHATRKRAKDAARRRGDRNNNNADGPHRKGGRHFHPKDADGNEIHDGMHDNFPY